MSKDATPVTSQRLIALARAMIEASRFEDPDRAGLEKAWTDVSGAVAKEQRAKIAESLGIPGNGAADAARTAEAPAGGPVQDLMKQRASLELKLQSEATRARELESRLRQEESNRKEAEEALGLQQRRLKELEKERSGLLEDIGKLESQLRLQINETEQVQLKFEKLKSSQQGLGSQAVEFTERINALESENARLKAEMELTLRDRDKGIEKAEAKTQAALDRTSDAAFRELWMAMNKELPDLFVETHVPNQQTFENLCKALIEMVTTFARIEAHVIGMLKELRQVSEQTDKLNHFYVMFQRNPSLMETMREFVTTGKKVGNFVQLMRALQAWARSFGSGLHKTIVKTPNLIADELNFRQWPLKTSFTQSEDAAIGKYFKDNWKLMPEKLGTEFRKEAANLAYEDYNELMKKQK